MFNVFLSKPAVSRFINNIEVSTYDQNLLKKILVNPYECVFLNYHTDSFLENSIFLVPNYDFAYFFDNFHEQLKQLKNKKIMLLIEGFSLHSPESVYMFEKLKTTIEKINLSAKDLYLISQLSIDADISKKIIPDINHLGYDKWLDEFFMMYVQRLPEVKPENNVSYKKFSIFSKRYEENRFNFFVRLASDDILKNSHFTFGNNDGENFNGIISKKDLISKIPKSLNDDKKQLVLSWIDGIPYTTSDNLNNHYPTSLDDYYERSGINIFIETNPMHGGSFITEKTYKPIYFKMPFISVTKAGSLAILRKMGYKTFTPFINESYDEAESYDVRVSLIHKEIKRLVKLSDTEFKKIVEECKLICEHNYKILHSEYLKPFPEKFTVPNILK